MIDIKDVLHLYIGCEVQWQYDLKSRFWLGSAGGGSVKLKTRRGSYISPVNEDDIKPILRPLSSLTEDESKQLDLTDVQIGLTQFADRLQMYMTAAQYWGMLKMGFDLFGLIESGQAIEALPALS